MSRLGRHSLLYGAGILLSKAISFIMLPLYTHYLRPADYGVLQLVELTLDVISIVAGARLLGGVFHFYHKEPEPSRQAKVLSTALVLLTSTYSVTAAAAFVAAPALSQLVFKTEAQTALIRIAAVTLAFQGMALVPNSYLQVKDRSTTYVIANAIRLVIQLSLNIFLLTRLGLGAKGILISSLATAVLFGVWGGAYQIRETGLWFSPPAARSLVSFGLPLVATQLAAFFNTFGDRYFLQAMTDSTSVGLYAFAYQFGFLLVSVGSEPFSMAWGPIRFEVARRPDRDAIYSQAFIYLNLLLITAAVGIQLFVGDFLQLAATPDYFPAAKMVPVLLVAYVFASYTTFHNTGLFVRERTGVVTLTSWSAAAISLIGYLLLIPKLGGMGAALATAAAFATQWVLVYVLAMRLWPITFNWAPVLRLIAVGTASCLLGIAVPAQKLLISIPLHGIILLGYMLVVYRLGLIPEEARSAIARYLLRIKGLLSLTRRSAG